MAPVLNRPRCWLRPCLAAVIVAVSTSSDADDVRALARRYDSAGCRRAIERTWHRFPFHEMAKSNRRSQEARRYELATGHRSMYVRVQKAGSRLLWFGLDRILGSPGNNRLRLRFCHPGPCSFVPERVFAWTVVRDPWDKALSAYADIHHHSECFARHFPNITALACDTTEADATRRFGEFLRTVTSGALACGESFHLWPSALLMDVIRPRAASGGARFGAVARLEHLRRDLPAVLRSAGHAQFNLSLLDSSQLRHSHAAEPCVANFARAAADGGAAPMLRDFCEIYHADYQCFGYDAPAACRRLVPELDWNYSESAALPAMPSRLNRTGGRRGGRGGVANRRHAVQVHAPAERAEQADQA